MIGSKFRRKHIFWLFQYYNNTRDNVHVITISHTHKVIIINIIAVFTKEWSPCF